jgi:nitrile hydratase accessory protein
MPSTSICGTIILSLPDQPAGAPAVPDADRIIDLPALLRDDGGPVFAEPWQAQAFALAVRLSEQGYFTWKEWAAALAAELKATADRGEPDDGSRYYHHWLAVLERLAAEKGLTDPAALAAARKPGPKLIATLRTASPSNSHPNARKTGARWGPRSSPPALSRQGTTKRARGKSFCHSEERSDEESLLLCNRREILRLRRRADRKPARPLRSE